MFLVKTLSKTRITPASAYLVSEETPYSKFFVTPVKLPKEPQRQLAVIENLRLIKTLDEGKDLLRLCNKYYSNHKNAVTTSTNIFLSKAEEMNQLSEAIELIINERIPIGYRNAQNYIKKLNDSQNSSLSTSFSNYINELYPKAASS